MYKINGLCGGFSVQTFLLCLAVDAAAVEVIDAFVGDDLREEGLRVPGVKLAGGIVTAAGKFRYFFVDFYSCSEIFSRRLSEIFCKARDIP
jgi:hypothetical protein